MDIVEGWIYSERRTNLAFDAPRIKKLEEMFSAKVPAEIGFRLGNLQAVKDLAKSLECRLHRVLEVSTVEGTEDW